MPEHVPVERLHSHLGAILRAIWTTGTPIVVTFRGQPRWTIGRVKR